MSGMSQPNRKTVPTVIPSCLSIQELLDVTSCEAEGTERVSSPAQCVPRRHSFRHSIRLEGSRHDSEKHPPSLGKQWYDNQISSPAYSVLAFLRDERNKDIHLKPVSPCKIISLEVVTTLHISGSVDYRVR